MSPSQKYDSLIFDLDGTLWEASHVVAQGWTSALRQIGDPRLISDNDIRSVTGKPQKECVKVLFPDLVGEAFTQRYEILDQYERQQFQKGGGKVYPGVEEGLGLLSKKFRIYLVSNCQDWYLESFFRYSGLKNYFLDSLCFGHNQNQKWENIRLVQEKNGLKNSLYIGDTLSDQKACEKAEVDFFFAAYGFAKYGAGKIDNFVAEANNFSEMTQWLMR